MLHTRANIPKRLISPDDMDASYCKSDATREVDNRQDACADMLGDTQLMPSSSRSFARIAHLRCGRPRVNCTGASSSLTNRAKTSLIGTQYNFRCVASSPARGEPLCLALAQRAASGARKNCGHRKNVIFATQLYAREQGRCMPPKVASAAARSTGTSGTGRSLQQVNASLLPPMPSKHLGTVLRARSPRGPTTIAA